MKNQIFNIRSTDWIDMVEEFTEIFRSFKNIDIYSTEILRQAEDCARHFDIIKKEKGLELFGESRNIFDAQNCYENLTEELVAEADLADQICKYDSSSRSIVNVEETLDVCKSYLKLYFGVEYNECWSEQQKYQINQLLLILYRCTANNKKNILHNMSKDSFWRFRNEEANPYAVPILFIKKELLKSIKFLEALAIEYFIGSLRHCINTLPLAIVNRVIDNLERKSSTIFHHRVIRDDLFEKMLINLKNINSQDLKLFKEPDNLFWQAYLNFSLLSIKDEINEPRLDIDLEDIYKENLISRTRNFQYKVILKRTRNNINETESLKMFLESCKLEISKYILNKKITSRDVKRHISAYYKLAQLFFLYNKRQSIHDIDMTDLAHIIYLYEYCQDKVLTVRTGYQGGRSGKHDKQLQTIVGELDEEITINTLSRETERGLYEIVCFLNTLNSIISGEKQKTIETRVEIKQQLFAYWRQVMPILADEPHKYNTLTELAESIISRDELLQYCKNKTKENKLFIFKK